MNQKSQISSTYAALSVAGQMGCFMLVFVGAALLAGLWLDSQTGNTRLWLLICVAGSIPLNLVITYFLTRWLTARVIPLDKPKSGVVSPGEEDA